MNAQPLGRPGFGRFGVTIGGRQHSPFDLCASGRRGVARDEAQRELVLQLGETLVGAADGVVSPQARVAFDAALAREPKSPRARYYLGLAAAQAGDLRAAFDRWYALAGDTPTEAPWRAALEEQLRRVAAELGIAIAEMPVAVDAAASADEIGSPAR